MIKPFHTLSILLATLAAFGLASQAQARRVWPPYGDRGDVRTSQECPDNQVLEGFTGRTGAWIDQIQLVCAPLMPNGLTGSPMPAGDRFGGVGGGSQTQTCPLGSRMYNATIVLGRDSKMVVAVDFNCVDLAGHFTTIWFRGSLSHCPNGVLDFGCTFPRVLQTCPNEDFRGINVNYGNDVNGLGFICDRARS